MPLSAKISSLQRQIQRLRIVLVLLLLLAATVTACYTSLFSFGDSLTDTGNLYFISPRQSPDCLLPPYGQTHFHRPNGRCSDGRLILDFLGIVQIPPYPLAFSVNFWHKSSFFLLLFLFFLKPSLWGFRMWNRIWVSRTARWNAGILSREWILRWPEPRRWTAVSLKKRGSLLMWPQTFLWGFS